MSLSDPIADMLTRIRNGQMARLMKVKMPHSKIKEEILKVMIQEGYIDSYEVEEVKTNIKEIIVRLKYVRNKAAINKIVRVSKPGSRKSISVESLKMTKFFNGLGISILSTSKGIMSDKDARINNVGGEVICNIY